MTRPSTEATSRRVKRTRLPGLASAIGMSVGEADRMLGLDGGGHGMLDTTHFDTTRFPPPDWAPAAFAQAAADGTLAYTPYRGHPEVLRQLAQTLGPIVGASLSAENLALTPGTQAALFATLAALIDEDDLVVVADPDYLFNERILAFLGARIRRVPIVSGPDGDSIELDALAQACRERPRLLLFSHPSNPLGILYSDQVLTRIAELAQHWDFRVVVDSLYCRLVYDGASFRHLAGLPGMADRCVTLLGPSKTESMSGYRIGVLTGPADVIEAVETVLSAVSLRAPAYAQQLLRRWWIDDGDFVATRVEELRAIHDTTLSYLRRVPYLRLRPAQATAYLFPDVSMLRLGDHVVAARLQRDAGVIVSPGYQFGPGGIGHFRTCYARGESEWYDALEKVVGVLLALGREQGL